MLAAYLLMVADLVSRSFQWFWGGVKGDRRAETIGGFTPLVEERDVYDHDTRGVTPWGRDRIQT